MNPLNKFKKFIIGEALNRTDDVFEKARIELTYSFTLFLIVMSFIYVGTVISNRIFWQYFSSAFALTFLPLILWVLKKTRNTKTAGYMFMFSQIILSLYNDWLNHFSMPLDGAFWFFMGIIFTFFVMGKTWGIAMVVFFVVQILINPVDQALGHVLLNYEIPNNELVPQNAFTVFIPLAINIYGLIQILNTRNVAEKKIREQKKILEENNKELASQKEDIISSISYARRIQYALLPHEETISRCIPLSFILYKPRDIVSGDFFWFHEIDRNNYIIVCADCTGHGVPGAFMTVIGSSSLNQIITENKTTGPSEIMARLDNKIVITLKQEKQHVGYVHDGMDLSLLKVDRQKKEFTFSSAKRTAIYIHNKQLVELKGNKVSLGGLRTGEKLFEETTIDYYENDIIYLFTDGYIDQFGGEKNKKFMINQFRQLLFSIHHLPMTEQKQKLDEAITNWIGNNEQTDDITVIGIRL